MWNSLSHLSIPGAELIIRAIGVYLFILLLLRVSGKKQLTQMSPTDFVAILLISNAVQNSMNGGDNSLAGGLILASVLVFMSWLISVLTYRNRVWRRIFEGVPTLLIHKGHFVQRNLDRERITVQELKSLLRRQGIHDFEKVRQAILESDGTLDVTREKNGP